MATTAPDPSSIAPQPSGAWGWFLGWVGAGALFSLSLLGIMTIGIFVFPIAAFVAVALTVGAKDRRSRGVAWGALCGASLPLFFVAYLNRRGPGYICDVTPTATHCVETWSPWPWLVVALLMVVAGVAAFVATRRPPPASRLAPPGPWPAPPNTPLPRA